jgi:hypothetical protein
VVGPAAAGQDCLPGAGLRRHRHGADFDGGRCRR